MGIMEKVGAKIATKYGTVTRGKYTGCQIALGNPPKGPVSTVDHFSQLIFVDGAEEKARFNIFGDLGCFFLLDSSEKGFLIKLAFDEDESCEFILDIRQEDKAMGAFVKSLLGQKTTATMTREEKLEKQYRGVKVFLWNTGLLFSPNSIDAFRELFEQLGILDDVTDRALQNPLK